MVITVYKNKAQMYLTYNRTNIDNANLTLYDLLNILQYGYSLPTDYTYDLDKNNVMIMVEGSITTVMNIRCSLRVYYGLRDLSKDGVFIFL